MKSGTAAKMWEKTLLKPHDGTLPSVSHAYHTFKVSLTKTGNSILHQGVITNHHHYNNRQIEDAFATLW